METSTHEEGGIAKTAVRPRNKDKVPGRESYARGKRSGGREEFAKWAGFCLLGATGGRTIDNLGGWDEGGWESAGGVAQAEAFGGEERDCAAAHQKQFYCGSRGIAYEEGQICTSEEDVFNFGRTSQQKIGFLDKSTSSRLASPLNFQFFVWEVDFPAVLCRDDQACECHFHGTLMENPSTLFSSILLSILSRTKEDFAILFFETINATPINQQEDKTKKMQRNRSIYDWRVISFSVIPQQTGVGVLEISQLQQTIHLLTYKYLSLSQN